MKTIALEGQKTYSLTTEVTLVFFKENDYLKAKKRKEKLRKVLPNDNRKIGGK